MDREEIIRMALEAGFCEPNPHDGYMGLAYDHRDGADTGASLERFAALVAAAEREKVAQWMTRQGCATGHGDSTEDLLKELEWQIDERIKNERSACAKVVEDYCGAWDDEGFALAAAIRARG